MNMEWRLEHFSEDTFLYKWISKYLDSSPLFEFSYWLSTIHLIDPKYGSA